MMVMTPTNQPFTIQGRDLFDERTWQKFLSTQDHLSEPYRLTEHVDPLVKGYRSWLLTSYTSWYQALLTQAELDWFEQVTLLVIVRKIMEDKYARLVHQQSDAFADPWVAEEMSILMRLNTMASEIAKSIHHIVKQKEAAQSLLKQLYKTHAATITARTNTAPCLATRDHHATAETRYRKGGGVMQENSAQAIFVYEAFDESTRSFVQQKTDETHLLLKRTAENILVIGHLLQAVKETGQVVDANQTG